jgi:hypothetical protein
MSSWVIWGTFLHFREAESVKLKAESLKLDAFGMLNFYIDAIAPSDGINRTY